MQSSDWKAITGAAIGVLLMLLTSHLLSSGAPVAGPPPICRAAPLTGETITVCQSGACDYATIQAAVDAVPDGAVIKVAAGVYTDVHTRTGPVGPLTQSVYVSKSITIRGGYTETNRFADPPDPLAYPTILDAQGRGRVFLIAGPVSPTIEGLQITGGDATDMGGFWGEQYGGGVYLFEATLTLSGCEILNNSADNGGGLYTYNSLLTLTNTSLSSNTATYLGGGGFLGGGRGLLTHNHVGHNTAGTGGGLYLANEAVTLTLNTFQANTAQDECGGLMVEVYSGWATLVANQIISNSAGWRGGGLCFGEAVLRKEGSGEIRLSGNQIISNIAGTDGGGGFLSGNGGTPDLNGNTILSNTAYQDGGGVYLDWSSEHTLLADNTIAYNVAHRNGGGLYLGSADVVVGDSHIQRNRAGERGGGIYGSGIIEHTILLANEAEFGGGLFLQDSRLTNNWIAGNRASAGGGGLYVAGGSAHLLHTTIAQNGGGGLWVTGSGTLSSRVRLTNTILVSHVVGITVTAGNTASLEGTLWGNLVDWGGDGSILTGTENLWGSPAFAAPQLGDYHLRPGSVAVGAGVDAGVTSDIDGEPRPAGPNPDLGADECWICEEAWSLYLPILFRAFTK